MDILIKFILSVSGLSWIITKSILFKGFRQNVTRGLNKYIGDRFLKSMDYKPKKYNKVIAYMWWLLDELINCSGCFGFWAGILFCPYHSTPFDYLKHGCIGAISAMILIRYSEKLKK